MHGNGHVINSQNCHKLESPWAHHPIDPASIQGGSLIGTLHEDKNTEHASPTSNAACKAEHRPFFNGFQNNTAADSFENIISNQKYSSAASPSPLTRLSGAPSHYPLEKPPDAEVPCERREAERQEDQQGDAVDRLRNASAAHRGNEQEQRTK